MDDFQTKLEVGVMTAIIVVIFGATHAMGIDLLVELEIWQLIALFAVIFFGVLFVFKMFKTRCPKCKKLLALKQYDWGVASTRDTTMTETKNIYNNSGKKVASYDQTVDATEYTNKHYMRCKYCGHECTQYSVNTYKK